MSRHIDDSNADYVAMRRLNVAFRPTVARLDAYRAQVKQLFDGHPNLGLVAKEVVSSCNKDGSQPSLGRQS